MNLIIYFIITTTHFFQNHYQTCIKKKGFDSCTTSIQQLYNNSSHEGGPQYVGPTLM
jgi:hypothetical protein